MPDVVILKQDFSISHKVPHMISVLRSGEDNQLHPALSWPLALHDVFKEPATYRVTVVVDAGGISQAIDVDVVWNGKWDTIDAKPVN
jgi:hypothetical protein